MTMRKKRQEVEDEVEREMMGPDTSPLPLPPMMMPPPRQPQATAPGQQTRSQQGIADMDEE
jgi:hypothetical protein